MRNDILMEKSAFAAFQNTTLYPAHLKSKPSAIFYFQLGMDRKRSIFLFIFPIRVKWIVRAAGALHDGIVYFQTSVLVSRRERRGARKNANRFSRYGFIEIPDLSSGNFRTA